MRKHDAFHGKLTANQIAQGMNAAEQNAWRLVEDASLLLENGRYPTAASIAILAIEEIGKVFILRELALAKTESHIAECWRNYRSHKKKNALWIAPQLINKGANKLDDFLSVFDETSEHASLLDQLKQLGFYSDCLGKVHWVKPPEIIEEELARGLVKSAQVLVRNREHSEKEIELWREHLGPVWESSKYSWMKQGLVNWHKAMREAGLTNEESGDMERFIHEGLFPEKDIEKH